MRVRASVAGTMLVMISMLGGDESRPQEVSSGLIAGRVLSQDGTPLANALVMVGTPQGTREHRTDAEGKFLIPFLPPGRYELKVLAAGYAPIMQPDVEVGLNQRTQIEFRLIPMFTEEMTVVAQTPLVDRSTTSIGANIKVDQIAANTPIGRNYTNLFFLVPGVTAAGAGANAGSQLQGNPSIGGASGLENAYIIDGVNVSNTGYGGIGSFNIVCGSLSTGVTTDFLDEVQIKTGGFEAEYGQALGGILNAIVRSGTNEFTGQVGLYWTAGSLERSRELTELTPTDVNVVEQDTLDLGFSIGGPFVTYFPQVMNTISGGGGEGCDGHVEEAEDLALEIAQVRLERLEQTVASA